MTPYLNEKSQQLTGILDDHQYNYCFLNVSANQCPETYNSLQSGKGVIVGAYNPAQATTTFMRLKVPSGNIQGKFPSYREIVGTYF